MERGLCGGFSWPPGAEQSSMPFQGSVFRQVPYLLCGLRPRVELRLFLSGPWYKTLGSSELSFALSGGARRFPACHFIKHLRT